jgi:hypothetical protein
MVCHPPLFLQKDLVMEIFTPEVVQSLGSALGACVLSIYFIHSFIKYQRDVMKDILEEMKEDRKLFSQAVQKLDLRLQFIERLLDKEK